MRISVLLLAKLHAYCGVELFAEGVVGVALQDAALASFASAHQGYLYLRQHML